MIVVFNQLAGLGIRSGLVRALTWVVTNAAALMLGFASVALATIPYIALLVFTVWRLTRPRTGVGF